MPQTAAGAKTVLRGRPRQKRRCGLHSPAANQFTIGARRDATVIALHECRRGDLAGMTTK
jgi:hypothetical protein